MYLCSVLERYNKEAAIDPKSAPELHLDTLVEVRSPALVEVMPPTSKPITCTNLMPSSCHDMAAGDRGLGGTPLVLV